MKLEVEVFMRAVLLAVLLMATGAAGQGFPLPIPPARSVIAYPPDGGIEAIVTNRVNTSPASAPDTSVYVTGINGSRVSIAGEVTGVSGGAVVTTVSNVPTVALQNGTQVSLTTASLNAITYSTGRGICEYNAGDPDSLTVSTAANIPSSPLSGRTAVTIWNLELGTKQLWCVPLGTASATAGVPVFSHTSIKFDGLNGGHVSCMCSTGSCAYAYLEEKCYQQAP